MKKIIAAISAALFVLSILAGCAEKPVVPVTSEQTAAPETEVRTDAATEPVTEAPVIEEDNFAGTPAYTTDGDKIIVDGVAYPNTKNMTMGVTYAVDDVGREVMTNAGQYRTDKYVGIFYFLWIGEHGDSGELDMTKIMEAGGEAAKKGNYSGWGPVGAMHFWGEPLYGYYYSKDTWVMRKHIEELTLANIDFVYIDITNGPTYMTNAKNLMKIMHEFNEQGYNAPKIVFYTHTSSPSVVKTIYDGIYKNDYMPDTWLMLDGKPAVIAYEGDCKSALKQEIFDFFSYREPQWPNEAQKKNGWPWMDFTRPQRVFKNKNGEREAISVSVAQHSGTVCFSDSAFYGDRTNRGRNFHNGKNDPAEDAILYGYNFQEQWDRACRADVPYVFVTGWNEWVAQRQDPNMNGRRNQVNFVDTASIEFSRDVEPMRGGYFDNYYMQLVDNIRKFKGSAPVLVQDTRKVIDIKGSFDQWNDILVTYADPTGDTVDRKGMAFGSKRVTDKSGNNDIIAAKIVYDKTNMYFYIETANEEGISDYEKDTSWMQLFINSDFNAATGFYGYDYVVNYEPKSKELTTLGKAKSNGKDFDFESVEDIEYRYEGNKMMIKVPLASLGINDFHQIKLSFKLVDSHTKVTTMEQMYSEGDVAPLGRLDYVFQNYK